MSRASIPLVVLAAGYGRRFGGPKQLAPVGPQGELLIDYTAHDARAAGFSPIVMVVRDEIEKVLMAHVETSWPPTLCVAWARQAVPAGTADAVLAARPHLDGSFAVVNADDIYPASAYAALHHHLTSEGPAAHQHAVVGFALGPSFVGVGPVKRGVCRVGRDGRLAGIAEYTVTRSASGRAGDDAQFTGTTGLGETVPLEWASTVSMNMWGFRPTMLAHLEASLAAWRGGEVILPEVVAAVLAGPAPEPVTVIPERSRCLGVTHAEDLPLLVDELGQLISDGALPARLFTE